MLALRTSSSSLLRREFRLSPAALGLVNFSWKVPELLKYCGLAEPADDDSPVRIILTFAGDRTKFSAKNANLSELTTLLLGEPLPYATLGYLWSAQLPLESIVMSPRTDRVRSTAVGGKSHPGRATRRSSPVCGRRFRQSHGRPAGRTCAARLGPRYPSCQRRKTQCAGPW